MWRSATTVALNLILTFVSFSAQAQLRSKKAAFQATKIGFIQQNFSGTKNKSFAEGAPAYALEMSTDTGGTFLRYFLKGRVSYAQGRQTFLDGQTEFTSNYSFSAFSPELGMSFYPVSRREKGMNMYVWGIGTLSYNYLDLTGVPDGSALKPKDQGFGSGYGGGLGFEMIFGAARGGSRVLMYGEVGFRDERVSIIKQSQFEISGLTFCLGVGF